MSFGTYVRRGYVDSPKVNQLNDSAECCFARAMLIADDAGRFDARPTALRSATYPVKDVPLEKIEAFLREAAAAKLLILYEVQGHPYGQLARWARRGNTVRSEFPWKDGSFEIAYVSLPTSSGSKDYVASSLNGDGSATPSGRGAEGVGMGAQGHGDGVRMGGGGGPGRIRGLRHSSSTSTPTPSGRSKRGKQPGTWELERLLDRTRAKITRLIDRYGHGSGKWSETHPDQWKECQGLRRTAEGLEKRLLDRARGLGEESQ